MQKKQFYTGAAILAFICLIAAIGLAGLSRNTGENAVASGPSDLEMLVGNWTENSTGVAVSFTDTGVFRVMDNDAANYTIDENNKTLILNYAEDYGGQNMTMTYQIDSATLTLNNTETGEVQTYARVVDATQ